MTYKNLLFIILACCTYTFLPAQNPGKSIAPFKIEMVNGKQFTYKQLLKNKPVVLIYFSPTCEHCKTFTAELLKHQKELASKQIVMITYLPVNEIKPFIEEFALNKYSNIIVGTEGYSFIVRKYYNVEKFPFIVLYNRQMLLQKILPYSDVTSQMVSGIIKS